MRKFRRPAIVLEIIKQCQLTHKIMAKSYIQDSHFDAHIFSFYVIHVLFSLPLTILFF
jgi:hypothetical protein